MATIKGGEYIVDFLIREKVPYVFGICGHGNVGLLDAMYDRRDELTLISPRHEQCAGHMADAFYRVRHQPVATLSSIGPGTANMVMPLANAYADSSAMLAITSNVPTQQTYRSAFQDLSRQNQTEFASVLRPVVKRTFQPPTVEALPIAMRQAMALTTSGRPGPVNLDLPFNLFQETGDLVYEPSQRPLLGARTGAAPEAVAAAVDMLLEATRPLIYAGNGVTLSEAGRELQELVRALQIPVVFLPNGLGTLDMRNPLALGFVGRNGAYQANEAARRCDVLLDLGARFDDRSASSWIPGYSWNIPPTRLIQVDIDLAEIGRTYPVALGVNADIKTFLRQLLQEIARRGLPDGSRSGAWRADIATWRKQWDAHIRRSEIEPGSPMHPLQVVADLRDALPDDAIVLPDVGAHHNWFMQFWEARRPQTLLNAYGYGGMGFGVCGVLGAKLAAPDRPCIAVCGDGGFSMAPHVLSTAVEYDIPAVWVVWNNFGWTSIRDIQAGMFGGREIGTMFRKGAERYNPDFAAMARSYGVEGMTVTNGRDFKDALSHAVGLGRPVLIDAHVNGDIHLPSTGAWQLHPTPYREPAFGKRYLPEQ